jgi:hypothetical protein
MRTLYRARRALRPAATLLAVLSVLAGLLGMHVLAAGHAMALPVQASAAHVPGAPSTAATHTGASAPCQASPECPAPAMQASCTPGSVPAQTAIPEPAPCPGPGWGAGGAPRDGAALVHRPPARAPSLLELSVSRT